MPHRSTDAKELETKKHQQDDLSTPRTPPQRAVLACESSGNLPSVLGSAPPWSLYRGDKKRG